MKVSRAELADTIAKRALKTGRSRKLAEEVAAYLLDNRRVNELDSILRDIQLSWINSGRIDAVATSAHTIDEAAKSQLTEIVSRLYPGSRSINIEEQYDPQIIGGVRLNLVDRQLDLSLEAKINQFKQLVELKKG